MWLPPVPHFLFPLREKGIIVFLYFSFLLLPHSFLTNELFFRYSFRQWHQGNLKSCISHTSCEQCMLGRNPALVGMSLYIFASLAGILVFHCVSYWYASSPVWPLMVELNWTDLSWGEVHFWDLLTMHTSHKDLKRDSVVQIHSIKPISFGSA